MTNYKSHLTYSGEAVTDGSYSATHEPPVGGARFIIDQVYFDNLPHQAKLTGTLTLTIDAAKGSNYDIPRTYSLTSASVFERTGLAIYLDVNDKFVVAYTGVYSGDVASTGTMVSRVVFLEEKVDRNTFIV